MNSPLLQTDKPRATHRYASLTARDIPAADLQALAELYKAAMRRLLGTDTAALVAEAEAEVAAKRAAGWTKADFAAALADELNETAQPVGESLV